MKKYTKIIIIQEKVIQRGKLLRTLINIDNWSKVKKKMFVVIIGILLEDY